LIYRPVSILLMKSGFKSVNN